jgi:CHAT domain-containing protein
MLREVDTRTYKTRTLKRLDVPDSVPSEPKNSPYYWAAFVLSGDWR